MAKKKYKNFKVEQDELKPIAIGAFESRKKTSIGTFIILTIFILAVIFLPQLSEVINEYLNPPANNPVNPVNPNNPATPEEPEEDDNNEDETFYEYVPNLKIEREEVIVSNINIDITSSTLTYSVTNNTTSYQDMEELNYYIEIYNEDRTLLERVKLVSPGLLAGGAFENYSRVLDASTASTTGYLVLVQKNTTDYPEVTLSTNANGSAQMVCTNSHETVTYDFDNNALKSVTSVIEYLSTDANYTEIYSNYQTLAETYNTTTGITSTFINSTLGFNITTIVDLEDASRTFIFNADTFGLDTEPKVVSFEMEALGFDCN